jgi:hypothetical protein
MNSVIWVLGISGVILLAIGTYMANNREPPDPSTGSTQLRVYTDVLTGCQYLRVKGGGLTPRMAGNGQQIGCKE